METAKIVNVEATNEQMRKSTIQQLLSTIHDI